MQLDKTFIAIRERDLLEILDLALHVFRRFFWPLVWALLAGIIPVALICHFLASAESGVVDPGEQMFYYTWKLIFLAVLTTPLATAPATLFLGQALFLDRPSPKKLARDLIASLPQLFCFQVLLRSILLVFGFAFFLSSDYWVVRVLLLLCIVICFPPYTFWPYLNEIILLERNPLFSKRLNTAPRSDPSLRPVTTMRRSSALHGGSIGDLFGRWLLSLLIAVAMVVMVMFALWGVEQWFTGTLTVNRLMYVIGLQSAVWIVIGYFCVARFLSYLDLRIRREGWEVELKMRAEAARLEKQLA